LPYKWPNGSVRDETDSRVYVIEAPTLDASKRCLPNCRATAPVAIAVRRQAERLPYKLPNGGVRELSLDITTEKR
jgi:hypothetical protein